MCYEPASASMTTARPTAGPGTVLSLLDAAAARVPTRARRRRRARRRSTTDRLAARVAAAADALRSAGIRPERPRRDRAPERRRLRREASSACSPPARRRFRCRRRLAPGELRRLFAGHPGRGADRARRSRSPPRPDPADRRRRAASRVAQPGAAWTVDRSRRRAGSRRRRARRVVVRDARASPPGGPHPREPLVGGGELLHLDRAHERRRRARRRPALARARARQRAPRARSGPARACSSGRASSAARCSSFSTPSG